MGVGVIGHVMNPGTDDAVAMAEAAEAAGADWMGFADAFWWRDVWMLLALIAGRTDRIEIGPAIQVIHEYNHQGQCDPDRPVDC